MPSFKVEWEGTVFICWNPLETNSNFQVKIESEAKLLIFLRKKKSNTPKRIRWQEIIKDRAEINQYNTENQHTQELVLLKTQHNRQTLNKTN